MVAFVRVYFLVIVNLVEVTPQVLNCPYQGCECYRGVNGCGAQNWERLPKLLVSHMDNFAILDLQGNPLTTIEAGSLPSGLSGINFEGDPLVDIDPEAFDGSSDTLTQLTFSNARFSQIPAALGHLNALTSLSIGDTDVRDWSLGTMKHVGTTLVSLSLDNVSLTTWPEWIQYCSHLQTLELKHSFITTPDRGLDTQLNTLTTLRLQNNRLSHMPLAVFNMSVLTELDLSNNDIVNISGLPSFATLSFLDIQYNNLSNSTHLSHTLRSVSDSLTYLQLEGNKLTSFPDLSFMNKLQSVYLSHNHIYDANPGTISASLTYLEIESNNIRSLAGFLSGGVNLKTLRLAANYITSLSGVDIPTSILELDVSTNVISELTDTSFPPSLTMDTLTLDYNPISTVSAASLAGLTNMRSLSLRGTKLTRLPLALITLPNLFILDMSQSPHLVCTCLEKSLRSWSVNISLTWFGDCGQTSIDYFLKMLSSQCP